MAGHHDGRRLAGTGIAKFNTVASNWATARLRSLGPVVGIKQDKGEVEGALLLLAQRITADTCGARWRYSNDNLNPTPVAAGIRWSTRRGCLLRAMLSAVVVNEPMPKMEPQSQQQIPTSSLELAKCVCCGLTEECTVGYIARVRDRWYGCWVCGLCCEAIDDEVCRSETLITAREALDRHTNFCENFKSSSPPANPTDHLISALIQLLRRGLDSPRSVRSTPTSPRGKGESGGGSVAFARSSSCFSTLAN